MLRESGMTPEQVSVDIKDRYTKYLEKMKKQEKR
jgi:protein involved in polysaccharide export with SLBB domain